ncbi:MAG: MBL fold metallo-hydrolase [Eubacteriales bacterium]
MNIHYIANTGFLVKSNNRKVLIDGIHKKQVDPYVSVDNETLHKIVHGEPPFDHLNLLLFTHYHWDHLDGELTIEALKHQPNLKLFSSKQTVDFLRTLPNYSISIDRQLLSDNLLLKETKGYCINSISFKAISLQHDGEEFKDVVNFAYVININDQIIFHCGDAKPNAFNYECIGLNKENITVALLDFPYFSLTSGRKIVTQYIKPKKIFVMHLPSEEKDTYHWLKTVKKVVTRYGDHLPEITLCINPNEEIPCS